MFSLFATQLLGGKIVIRVMASLRRLLRRSLGCFCALNGILDFNADIGPGKSRRSRCLFIYRILHNFAVISLTLKFQLDFLDHFKNVEMSTLMTVNFFTYFALVFFAVLSSMASCYQWQNRILAVLKELKHQKDLSRHRGYRVPRDKQSSLDRLLIALTILLILRLSIHLATFAFSARMGFNHPCNCFLPECMIFSMNYLFFAILAEVTQCWWCLLAELKMVLLDRDFPTVTSNLCEIKRLHTRFQCLIDLTSEVCSIFSYFTFAYMVRNLWSGIVSGYLVVRFVIGYGLQDLELVYLAFSFIICVQPLMFSLILNCMTNTAGSLVEVTRDILKIPHNESAEVERSIEWLSLQLTWQHTHFTVFGIFHINRSSAFRFASLVLVHVVYMVQSDYISITK
ncbi:putative gustatory receptor 85a [Drosophila santomea]|uniref:putative gustatory receptor 85a n=1 Tax=Drosophila santomea TaxID=129105 RepID=UPI0019543794|nr:putative gustatory receptor 85a [Drosophila santomea]